MAVAPGRDYFDTGDIAVYHHSFNTADDPDPIPCLVKVLDRQLGGRVPCRVRVMHTRIHEVFFLVIDAHRLIPLDEAMGMPRIS